MRAQIQYRGRDRGFSTMLVILFMLFLSVVIMALGTLFSHQAHRTRALQAETQLRQLLLAAVPAAKEELKQHGTVSRDAEVTVPVDGARLVLHIAPVNIGETRVLAAAGLSDFKASQTLFFSNGGELQSATLMQTAGE